MIGGLQRNCHRAGAEKGEPSTDVDKWPNLGSSVKNLAWRSNAPGLFFGTWLAAGQLAFLFESTVRG
jgi:hypothetical protein